MLLLISSFTEVISPDDLLLFARSAAVILAAQLPLQEELACSIGFSIAGTALLLVPFLAVLIGRQRVVPLLRRGKTPLLRRGEWWWAASASGCAAIWVSSTSAV